MKKKIIYSSILNKETSFFIEYLNKHYDWEPVVMIIDDHLLNHYKKIFPNTIFLNSMKMRQNNFDYTAIKKFIAIDKKIIEQLSINQSNYLSWLEDTTGWNFSHKQRKEFYYQNLNFFNSLLNNLNIDLFISFTWPHVSCDYALYLMCKKIFKIPVLFYDVIPFFDNQSRLIHSSYENMSETINLFYKKTNKRKHLSKEVVEYLNNIKSKAPKSHSNIINFYNSNKLTLSEIFRDFMKLIKIIIFFQFNKKSQLAFKKNALEFNQQSQLTLAEYIFFKYRVAFNNFKLKINYLNLCDKFNYKEKYIYYPGPYQPEAMSNLVPGVFEDCFVVLDMIKSTIPKGWKVFYKEHPATFSSKSKGSLEKNMIFYKKLKQKYSFLKILPHNTNAFTLIDNSQCVMTAGGTSGWEAIIRGKPCILFGTIWYEHCNSVFRIETLNDLNTVFSEILSGKTPLKEDVDFFVECLFMALSKNSEFLNTKQFNKKKFEEYMKSLPYLAKDLDLVFKEIYEKK